MDDTELHYLAYDADEMFQEMLVAYMGAGGSVIRAGDEKEMLLRGVQSTFMLAFAGIDNALRMATLRYAVGEYLGMKIVCHNIPMIARLPPAGKGGRIVLYSAAIYRYGEQNNESKIRAHGHSPASCLRCYSVRAALVRREGEDSGGRCRGGGNSGSGGTSCGGSGGRHRTAGGKRQCGSGYRGCRCHAGRGGDPA